MGAFLNSRPSTPSSLRPHEPYTGTISVSIRPNPNSVGDFMECPWLIDESNNSIGHEADPASFQFDNVFPPSFEVGNRQVYQSVCREIVHKFLHQHYNGTVFAYGMTGLGKTYSMKGSEQDPGFVSLAIDEVFNKIALTPQVEHNLTMSYLEIYNEKIVDLLSAACTDLKIRDDPIYGTKIVGISLPVITSKYQLLQLIRRGDLNRKTSATDFNARSSRSHAIIQLKLSQVDLTSQSRNHSILSMCDLAGSERATLSLERRKEGSFINKSLLTLSNVINKLSMASTGQSPSTMEHIPYRDSKLTRFLQPALSGSSLISILCTIDIGGERENTHSVLETYKTLRFAARAKDVMMNVQSNQPAQFREGDTDQLIQELQQTIQIQKSQLEMTTKEGSGHVNSSVEAAELRGEIRMLNEKIKHLTRLCDLQKTETAILKNDALNDIVGSGTDSLQVMMANLEDFCRRTNYEVQEYKLYAFHLENQLKEQVAKFHHLQVNQSPGNPQRKLEAKVAEQAEELEMLRELLKDKDHILSSISKASELRRLVESNTSNLPSRQKWQLKGTQAQSINFDQENISSAALLGDPLVSDDYIMY